MSIVQKVLKFWLQDGASDRSSSPTDNCFSPTEPTIFGSLHDDEASRSDLESWSEFNGRNSALGDNESGFGDEASDHISVRDFSAVNEFFEFRLYDSVSAAHMNRIWDEAIETVNRKSATAHHHYSKNTLVLARPVNDQLALWEM